MRAATSRQIAAKDRLLELYGITSSVSQDSWGLLAEAHIRAGTVNNRTVGINGISYFHQHASLLAEAGEPLFEEFLRCFLKDDYGIPKVNIDINQHKEGIPNSAEVSESFLETLQYFLENLGIKDKFQVGEFKFYNSSSKNLAEPILKIIPLLDDAGIRFFQFFNDTKDKISKSVRQKLIPLVVASKAVIDLDERSFSKGGEEKKRFEDSVISQQLDSYKAWRRENGRRIEQDLKVYSPPVSKVMPSGEIRLRKRGFRFDVQTQRQHQQQQQQQQQQTKKPRRKKRRQKNSADAMKDVIQMSHEDIGKLGRLLEKKDVREIFSSTGTSFFSAEHIWEQAMGVDIRRDAHKISKVTLKAFEKIKAHQEQFGYGIDFDNLPTGFSVVSNASTNELILVYDSQAPLNNNDSRIVPSLIKPLNNFTEQVKNQRMYEALSEEDDFNESIEAYRDQLIPLALANPRGFVDKKITKILYTYPSESVKILLEKLTIIKQQSEEHYRIFKESFIDDLSSVYYSIPLNTTVKLLSKEAIEAFSTLDGFDDASKNWFFSLVKQQNKRPALRGINAHEMMWSHFPDLVKGFDYFLEQLKEMNLNLPNHCPLQNVRNLKAGVHRLLKLLRMTNEEDRQTLLNNLEGVDLSLDGAIYAVEYEGFPYVCKEMLLTPEYSVKKDTLTYKTEFQSLIQAIIYGKPPIEFNAAKAYLFRYLALHTEGEYFVNLDDFRDLLSIIIKNKISGQPEDFLNFSMPLLLLLAVGLSHERGIKDLELNKISIHEKLRAYYVPKLKLPKTRKLAFLVDEFSKPDIKNKPTISEMIDLIPLLPDLKEEAHRKNFEIIKNLGNELGPGIYSAVIEGLKAESYKDNFTKSLENISSFFKAKKIENPILGIKFAFLLARVDASTYKNDELVNTFIEANDKYDINLVLDVLNQLDVNSSATLSAKMLTDILKNPGMVGFSGIEHLDLIKKLLTQLYLKEDDGFVFSPDVDTANQYIDPKRAFLLEQKGKITRFLRKNGKGSFRVLLEMALDKLNSSLPDGSWKRVALSLVDTQVIGNLNENITRIETLRDVLSAEETTEFSEEALVDLVKEIKALFTFISDNEARLKGQLPKKELNLIASAMSEFQRISEPNPVVAKILGDIEKNEDFNDDEKSSLKSFITRAASDKENKGACNNFYKFACDFNKKTPTTFKKFCKILVGNTGRSFSETVKITNLISDKCAVVDFPLDLFEQLLKTPIVRIKTIESILESEKLFLNEKELLLKILCKYEASFDLKQLLQTRINYPEQFEAILSHIHLGYTDAGSVKLFSEMLQTFKKKSIDEKQVEKTIRALNKNYDPSGPLDKHNIALIEALGTFSENEKYTDIVKILIGVYSAEWRYKPFDINTLIKGLISLEKKDLEQLSKLYDARPSPKMPHLKKLIEASKESTEDNDSFSLAIKSFKNNPFDKNERDLDAQLSVDTLAYAIGNMRNLNENNYLSPTLQDFYLIQQSELNDTARELAVMDRENMLNRINERREVIKNSDAKEADKTAARLDLLAIFREVMYRTTGLFPRQTQILSVMNAILQGKNIISEIPTGEGKGLVTTLYAAMLHFEGYTVDVCTSNTDLAQRDQAEFEVFYDYLNIKSSYVDAGSEANEYLTNGINYSDVPNLSLFRSKVKFLSKGGIKPPENIASVIDEVDDTIFDNTTQFNFAMNIDGGYDPDVNPFAWVYPLLNNFIDQTGFMENGQTEKEDIDAAIEYLTANARSETQKTQLIRILDENPRFRDRINAWIDSAIDAKHLYERRDEDYTVRDARRIIQNKEQELQEASILSGGIALSSETKWGLGVHQFLHARATADENNHGRFWIDPELPTILTSTCKEFLDVYDRIIGITGTIGSARERKELKENGFDLFEVPPNAPNQREEHAPVFANDELAQFTAMLSKIKSCQAKGQPVLIICESPKVEKRLYEFLKNKVDETKLQLVDGTPPKAMDDIVRDAAQDAYVTVGTPRLGRGTDIKPENENGLFVIPTFAASERQLRQFIGRAARNGMKGRSQAILNITEVQKKFGHLLGDRNIHTMDEGELFFLITKPKNAMNQKKRKITQAISSLKSVLQERFFEVYKIADGLEDASIRVEMLRNWGNFFSPLDRHWEKCLASSLAPGEDPYEQSIEVIQDALEKFREYIIQYWCQFVKDYQHRLNLKNSDDFYLSPEHFDRKGVFANFQDYKDHSFGHKTYDKWESAHAGSSVTYTRMFAGLRAFFTGKRGLFPNIRAWWKNRGVLFAETKAWWKGSRKLFANTRSAISKWWNGSKVVARNAVLEFKNDPDKFLEQHRDFQLNWRGKNKKTESISGSALREIVIYSSNFELKSGSRSIEHIKDVGKTILSSETYTKRLTDTDILFVFAESGTKLLDKIPSKKMDALKIKSRITVRKNISDCWLKPNSRTAKAINNLLSRDKKTSTHVAKDAIQHGDLKGNKLAKTLLAIANEDDSADKLRLLFEEINRLPISEQRKLFSFDDLLEMSRDKLVYSYLYLMNNQEFMSQLSLEIENNMDNSAYRFMFLELALNHPGFLTRIGSQVASNFIVLKDSLFAEIKANLSTDIPSKEIHQAMQNKAIRDWYIEEEEITENSEADKALNKRILERELNKKYPLFIEKPPVASESVRTLPTPVTSKRAVSGSQAENETNTKKEVTAAAVSSTKDVMQTGYVSTINEKEYHYVETKISAYDSQNRFNSCGFNAIGATRKEVMDTLLGADRLEKNEYDTIREMVAEEIETVLAAGEDTATIKLLSELMPGSEAGDSLKELLDTKYCYDDIQRMLLSNTNGILKENVAGFKRDGSNFDDLNKYIDAHPEIRNKLSEEEKSIIDQLKALHNRITDNDKAIKELCKKPEFFRAYVKRFTESGVMAGHHSLCAYAKLKGFSLYILGKKAEVSKRLVVSASHVEPSCDNAGIVYLHYTGGVHYNRLNAKEVLVEEQVDEAPEKIATTSPTTWSSWFRFGLWGGTSATLDSDPDEAEEATTSQNKTAP